MHKLIIIGAGGFGREVLSWARHCPEHGRMWQVHGFLDENPSALDGMRVSVPVLGRPSDYQPRADEVFVCAIGAPKLRRSVQESMVARGGRFVNVVHPSSIVADNVMMGTGVIVCPQVIITVNVTVGDGVAFNLQTIVGHDAVIGSFCQISPHCDILGYAQLGDEVFMGSQAVVLPGVKLGSRCVLGAGAVASRDILEGVTAVGMPAKPR